MKKFSLSPGKYKAKIISMVVGLKENDKLQVITTFCVEVGQYAGKKHMVFSSLETEQDIVSFQHYVESLGVDLPENPVKLPSVLNKFVKSNYRSVEIVITENLKWN